MAAAGTGTAVSRRGVGPPSVRANRESASTVMTGRACTERECACPAPAPVGGDDCVRVWCALSARARSRSGCEKLVTEAL